MSEKIKKIEPVDVLLVTFRRLPLLKITIRKFYERTRYPHNILVINNAIDDRDTIKYLTFAKNCGYIHNFISLPKNDGLANAFTEGFNHLGDKVSTYILTSQDDVIPPYLEGKCWLERLLDLFKKYEKDYGAISCRTQRCRRRDIDEEKEIIDSPTSLASFNRLQKSEDIKIIGGFTKRPRWESPEIAKNMKNIKKKLGISTHIYVNDNGFMGANKSYDSNFKDYLTYSPERVNQGELQPYPTIDQDTNVPMKINTPRDLSEHQKRLVFWKLYGFKKSAVMLEALRHRHAETDSKAGVQMGEFVHFLYTLARDYPNTGKIVEIGTYIGVSTNAFLYGLHDRIKHPWEPDRKMLYSIDINPECKVIADVDVDIDHMWRFIEADSTKFKWGKGKIDILLIDGDHSYEAVKADYENFEPFVRSEGLILLHDVCWDDKGVKKFYEELGSPGIVLPLGPSGMAIITKK